MDLGMIGLGRMGWNMMARLMEHGLHPVGYDPDPAARARAEAEGGKVVASLENLVAALSRPRTVWVMVPAGDATEEVLHRLAQSLEPDDVVVDGGNSYFRDTLRRKEALAARGIELVDAGTSGGIWGRQEGYCIMAGGSEAAVERLRPVFAALAPPGGFLHVGPTGAGHFVKMVHNGIEYGMLAALGEGFEILQAAPFPLPLGEIAELWRHGSVIRSWLLDLLASAYAKHPGLEGIAGYVEDSGEGRWTVAEAIAENVPAPVITHALISRLVSRQRESYAARVVAALRQEFGGHPVRTEKPR
ncbi:MAG: decarboxylating 6-phosphogluconate dehydrogenase [Firmicutes bacterium]|nr:decarboxylating 6-phosphogluconate dehydrogenase [Alicyclobacillaceae bacterium]MCL6496560.1 decarboxylating 6-phosphogluconate dehydrogenase [Bacillota bacterium]